LPFEKLSTFIFTPPFLQEKSTKVAKNRQKM